MTIELHVWGPAFGLPSIDATCLGTIAYLRECLPHGSWSIVAASDPSLNPLNALPALRNEHVWVAGFEDIVDHLRTVNDDWDLDQGLTESETADCVAYTSFIESRGQPLLDLHLYVSSENYSERTSPALAKLLKWPHSWLIPHRLRDRARKTSEHLGLGGLDVDSAQEQEQEPKNDLSSQIPQSLRKPQQTVNAMLGHDTRRSKFRLDAVTSDFLAPLNEALAKKEWLITDHVTSADCLCLGYLALMLLVPKAPQPWLQEALERQYPRLGRWMGRGRHAYFDDRDRIKKANGSATMNGDIKPEDTNAPPEQGPSKLPWQPAPQHGVAQTVNNLILHFMDAIPILGQYLSPTQIAMDRIENRNERARRKQVAIKRARAWQLWYGQLLTSSVSAATLAAVLAYNGILRLPNFRSQSRSQRTFGEAGAILGLGRS